MGKADKKGDEWNGRDHPSPFANSWIRPWCGGMFSDSIITDVLLIVTVK